jgi:hypothetical protein
MPPQAFGALAFIGFLALLGVLWAFRNTAQKVAGPAHHGDATSGHQGGHH